MISETVVETTEPDQLSEAVQQVMATPYVDRLRTGRFNARVNMAAFSRLGMMTVAANNLHVEVPAGTGYTTVNMPLAGEITTDQGTFSAGLVPHTADVTLTELPLTLKSEATTTMVMRFDDLLLEEAAVKLTGGRSTTALNFDGVLNLRYQPGRMFAHRANLAWSAIHSDELNEPTRQRPVELELAADFLLAAQAERTPALGAHDDAPVVAAIQRVEEWIMANLAEPISRADLCDVSGLHVRTLTRG
ncbi:MAG: hypothetical protein ACR2PZ_21190, partial [Pseudomonadales bacterium]